MSDQTTPVEIFTEATWEVEMLSSLLPNRRFFTRLTRSGLTTMRVGNHRFPLVQRLAVKVSSELADFGLAAFGPAGFAPEAVIPIRARPSSRSIRSRRSGCREKPASQSVRKHRAP